MVELSVRRKSPSSIIGTRQFGFLSAYGGFMCSPVKRSTTWYSTSIFSSATHSMTMRLVVEAGW